MYAIQCHPGPDDEAVAEEEEEEEDDDDDDDDDDVDDETESSLDSVQSDESDSDYSGTESDSHALETQPDDDLLQPTAPLVQIELSQEQQEDRTFAIHAIAEMVKNYSSESVARGLEEVAVLDAEVAEKLKAVVKGLLKFFAFLSRSLKILMCLANRCTRLQHGSQHLEARDDSNICVL